jgi:hypothetical protein
MKRLGIQIAALAALLPLFAMSSDEKPRALEAWDTATSEAEPLAPAAIAAQGGWVRLTTDAAAIAGDVVATNGRTLIALRKKSAAVDVYSMGAAGAVSRARLTLLAPNGDAATAFEKFALTESTKGAISVEGTYRTEQKASLSAKFRLKKGDVSLEIVPGSGAGRVRIDCPGRYVVLPDLFADDIVIDARKIPSPSAEVPSENFLLHLTGNGDSIAMCVFENRQQDIKVLFSGAGENRTVSGSEIDFGPAKDGVAGKVWLAMLEAPHIWHARDLKPEDTGKTVALDWKMPFSAQYRVDFTRPNELIDSWEMLLQPKEGGKFIKTSWLGSGEESIDADRKRWNTVLGSYHYPCWSNADMSAFLQPLKNENLSFAGPVVLYPINRVKQTPYDAYTVIDVMRDCLGVGPCQYILDMEGQKAEYKGRATCSSRDKLKAIYGANQQKEKRAEVEKVLDDDLIFVKHIRGRIARYVEFGHQMRAYLAEQKKAHPELSVFIDDMDKIAGEIDSRFAARQDKIKTPDHVAAMNDEFRKNVLDDTGPDALKKCKAYAEALVVIGDNQDELSGECRWAVKSLRQRAGILMAMDPKVAPVATEIRARTQEALKNPANHEGARH